jgi:hypothetical protein
MRDPERPRIRGKRGRVRIRAASESGPGWAVLPKVFLGDDRQLVAIRWIDTGFRLKEPKNTPAVKPDV